MSNAFKMTVKVAYDYPTLRPQILPYISKVAEEGKKKRDIPKDVHRYVKETKEQSPGKEEAYYWAVAWSRYCKYKKPDSDHCQLNKGDYFPGQKKKAFNQRFDLIRRNLEANDIFYDKNKSMPHGRYIWIYTLKKEKPRILALAKNQGWVVKNAKEARDSFLILIEG